MAEAHFRTNGGVTYIVERAWTPPTR